MAKLLNFREIAFTKIILRPLSNYGLEIVYPRTLFEHLANKYKSVFRPITGITFRDKSKAYMYIDLDSSKDIKLLKEFIKMLSEL